MKKVVVLGGCGVVGSVAVRTLAQHGGFAEIVIGDANEPRARALAAEGGPTPISFFPLDAARTEEVRAAVRGSQVVLNCVGPFYKTVKTILDAVLAEGVDYVDVCDDVDVTLEILQRDEDAKRAGVTALVGMGASPGATNLLARYIADTQLDEPESVDIFHCHGGEPSEGPGVIGHRFHCMSIDIPMFLDGKLEHVRYFEESGLALRETFDFPLLGPTPLFPYPHPEQVTLPRYLPLRRVTNKGSVLPIPYYELTAELCRLGLASKDPVDVHGHPVLPYDFAVAFLQRERERMLREADFGPPRGCMSVIVKGRKDGKPREVRVHMFSGQNGLGEGTGIPAAIGVILLQQGKITTHGVLPPEACIDPADFLPLAMQAMKARPASGSAKQAASLLFETIEPDGSVHRMEM